MNSKRGKYFVLFLFLVFSAALPGQSNTYTKHFLTVENGLSQNDVTGILKDSKGFMWFTTRGGLNRFDGYEFVQHKSRVNKKDYLSNPSLECIFEDKNGDFWIGR